MNLGDLKFRQFKGGKSSKTGCPVSAAIPMQEFLNSKICSDNNKIVPIGGQQVVAEFQNRIEKITGEKRNWNEVYVYRDHLRFDGYVEQHTQFTTQMPLLSTETPIKDLVFERAIGTLDLLPPANGMRYRMAFRYEPKLLEVAIGPNVDICNNFNIFGGKRWTANRNFPFEALITMFEDRIKNLEHDYNSDMATINFLMNEKITTSQIDQLIGKMSMLYHTDQVLPITAITDMCRSMRSDYKSGEIKTFWDFTQAGTNILKFDSSSGEDTLETIQRFNTFVTDSAMGTSDILETNESVVEILAE